MELYINKKNLADIQTFAVSKKVYEISAALISTFGLIVQWLIISERTFIQNIPLLASIKISVMFMTIWSNVLICILFWLLVFNVKNFMTSNNTKSAFLGYILIVFTVYHFVLAGYWNPTGKVAITNLIFHYIIPGIYAIYWLFFSQKQILKYDKSLIWLWFPTIYAAFIFTNGYFTNVYPYPIYNVDTLPMSIVVRNVVLTTFAYFIFGLIIITINNFIIKRNQQLAAVD